MIRKKMNKKMTFLRARSLKIVVDAMTKSVDFAEVLREYETRVLLLEVGDDLVDRRRDLQEEGMVKELDETVERQLKRTLDHGERS